MQSGLQRGVASFSAAGRRPRGSLYEMPVKVTALNNPLMTQNGPSTLTHTVSPDSGFTTSIELEVKIDDLVWTEVFKRELKVHKVK
jgi:phage protein D